MRKAFSAILTPLLLGLVALPLASASPNVSSGSSAIGISDSPGLPAARPGGPVARLQPALKGRAADAGSGDHPVLARAASSDAALLDLQYLHLDLPTHTAPATGSARRLPVLPTGPPSHS